MPTKMVAVRVDDELEKRFKNLARQTGRTATFYVREALERHIEDLEDRYAAERALERVRSGEEPIIDFEDWEREYDAKMADTTDENRKRTVGRSGSRGRSNPN